MVRVIFISIKRTCGESADVGLSSALGHLEQAKLPIER
jgi:hypothetical protein